MSDFLNTGAFYLLAAVTLAGALGVVLAKKLVVVDDAIVRGNTQRALIRMLREAGAAEVHVRIASPPVKWPCFYGIDFASRYMSTRTPRA